MSRFVPRLREAFQRLARAIKVVDRGVYGPSVYRFGGTGLGPTTFVRDPRRAALRPRGDKPSFRPVGRSFVPYEVSMDLQRDPGRTAGPRDQ